MLDLKFLMLLGLVCGFVGTGFLALPSFKNRLQNSYKYNPIRIDENSTRTGLILIGFGFVLQFVVVWNQP